jgi:nucleoside-diphosphate-sugar epimerase
MAEGSAATILVSGATSQIGVFLLPLLDAAGFRVLALSRRVESGVVEVMPGIHWAHPDRWADYKDETIRGFISCGPLERAAGWVGDLVSLEKIVAFSSSSVLSKRLSPDALERRKMEELSQAETMLKSVCRERDLSLLLLRPTLIWGCGRDSNVSMLAAIGRRLRFIPVASGAGGMRQPVHAGDLAALAVKALAEDRPFWLESPVAGGTTLSYGEMVNRIAIACGRGVRSVSLAPALLSVLVGLAGCVPGMRGLNREMVTRQSRDLVFDDSGLREQFDWRPRPFAPAPVDFEIPGYAMKYTLNH